MRENKKAKTVATVERERERERAILYSTWFCSPSYNQII